MISFIYKNRPQGVTTGEAPDHNAVIAEPSSTIGTRACLLVMQAEDDEDDACVLRASCP